MPTADLLKWAVVLILSLAGGTAGWVRTNQHGAETERRKEAEEERDEANEILRHRSRPMPTDREYGDRLRRAKDRLARLRDRETKR